MAAPDFLTVEEAARILRIGRTAAYLAAKRYRQTNGGEGLPCVAIRGSLRVPRRQLEALAGGPIDGLASPVTEFDQRRRPDSAAATTPGTRPKPATRPKRAAAPDAQRPLPFTG